VRRRYIEIRPDTKIVNLGGRPPKIVLSLLVAQVGLFLIYAFADGPPWVAEHLAASADRSLLHLQLYQPLTALVIHLGTRGLLFNALSLWIFGSALERYWGPWRFLLFFVVTGAVGLLVGVFFGLLKPQVALYGSGGATLAMTLAVALIFPAHMIFFFGLLPIKARLFGLVLAGFLLLGNLLGSHFLEAAVEAGGALCALPFVFPPNQLLGRLRVRRAKRKLKVVEGGKRDDKRYLN
jgi:membrane associated rhomboid family serine protease